MSFLMSLSNSVEYAPVESTPYTDNSYYKVDVTDAPDYREYYSGTLSASNKLSCKTTNYSAQGKKVSMTTDVAFEGYWFENAVFKSEEDLASYTSTFTFVSDGFIIMPFDGKLNTDSTTNRGDVMTVVCSVNGKDFRLTFESMECWYCDVGRENIDATHDYHTSDNQKGKTFKAGNVLGRAKGGVTKVTVKPIKNGSVVGTCTVSQFYKLQYTPN